MEKTVTCGQCGKKGHNRRTCGKVEPITVASVTPAPTETPPGLSRSETLRRKRLETLKALKKEVKEISAYFDAVQRNPMWIRSGVEYRTRIRATQLDSLYSLGFNNPVPSGRVYGWGRGEGLNPSIDEVEAQAGVKNLSRMVHQLKLQQKFMEALLTVDSSTPLRVTKETIHEYVTTQPGMVHAAYLFLTRDEDFPQPVASLIRQSLLDSGFISVEVPDLAKRTRELPWIRTTVTREHLTREKRRDEGTPEYFLMPTEDNTPPSQPATRAGRENWFQRRRRAKREKRERPRALVEQARARHDKVRTEYGEYLSDILAIANFPTLSSGIYSEHTQLFEQTLMEMEDAQRTNDPELIHATAIRLENAWKQAKDNALISGQQPFDAETLSTITTAKHLLASAADASAGNSETYRQQCAHRALDLLKKVIVVPEQAERALRNTYQLELTQHPSTR